MNALDPLEDREATLGNRRSCFWNHRHVLALTPKGIQDEFCTHSGTSRFFESSKGIRHRTCCINRGAEAASNNKQTVHISSGGLFLMFYAGTLLCFLVFLPHILNLLRSFAFFAISLGFSGFDILCLVHGVDTALMGYRS